MLRWSGIRKRRFGPSISVPQLRFLLMEMSQKKTFWYNSNMYTKNEDELIALGKELGSLLEKNDVLILTGELGAGKTTLTKGLAKGL